MLPIADIVVIDNPPDVLAWTVSGPLTAIEFKTTGVHIDAPFLAGRERWPDVTPPGWDGPLQYTLGLVLNIGGVWRASACIEYWFGLDANGGGVLDNDQIPRNWYYSNMWDGLQNHQPAPGEHVGLLVAAGNLRHVTDGSQSPLKARAALVEFVWPAAYGVIPPVWTEGSSAPPDPTPPPANIYTALADQFDILSSANRTIAQLIRSAGGA